MFKMKNLTLTRILVSSNSWFKVSDSDLNPRLVVE